VEEEKGVYIWDVGWAEMKRLLLLEVTEKPNPLIPENDRTVEGNGDTEVKFLFSHSLSLSLPPSFSVSLSLFVCVLTCVCVLRPKFSERKKFWLGKGLKTMVTRRWWSI
jgi:hypothetical protein